MDFYHISYHLTACQTEINSVRSLTFSVTDIGTKISCTIAACCFHSFSYFFHQNIQMTTSRVTVAKRTFNHNLWF